jgi:hypothetical protein
MAKIHYIIVIYKILNYASHIMPTYLSNNRPEESGMYVQCGRRWGDEKLSLALRSMMRVP